MLKILLTLLCIATLSTSKDTIKFLEPDVQYLADFYAPWCGYCKQFEPIFDEIAKIVSRDLPHIKLVKIDATVNTFLADKYDVHSFPTIKYIHNEQIIDYRGERNVHSILNFLLRVDGPKVKEITNLDRFNTIRSLHKEHPFFLLIRENDQFHQDFIDIFEKKDYQINFYKVPISFVHEWKDKSEEVTPSIMIIKEGIISKYEPTTSLEEWVEQEKVLLFPRVNGFNFWRFIGKSTVEKLICVFLVDKAREGTTQKFFEAARTMAFHGDALKRLYHLTWSDDVESFNNLLLSFTPLPTPNIVIVNVTDFSFYLPKNYRQALTDTSQEALTKELLGVNELEKSNFDMYSGMIIKGARVIFSIVYNFVIMSREAPGMTMFLMAIPIGALSIFIYICCFLSTEEESSKKKDNNYDSIQRQAPAQAKTENLDIDSPELRGYYRSSKRKIHSTAPLYSEVEIEEMDRRLQR